MKYIVKDRELILDAPLDYRAILTCGQIFRFKEVEGGYEVYSGRNKCRVGGNVIVTDNPEYFAKFFDLNTDYDEKIEELSKFEELYSALEAGKGIRILRQNLFEVIISFIISANNNIPRIKGIIERLCAFCGEDMGSYYAFPTPARLKSVGKEQLRMLGAGFRDEYLAKTSQILADTEFLSELEASDTAKAQKMLLSLPGVGPKVADCILLFGLRKWDCFPVDTWIFKRCSSAELNTPVKVREHYLHRYGSLAGLAQQYMFYESRER